MGFGQLIFLGFENTNCVFSKALCLVQGIPEECLPDSFMPEFLQGILKRVFLRFFFSSIFLFQTSPLPKPGFASYFMSFWVGTFVVCAGFLFVAVAVVLSKRFVVRFLWKIFIPFIDAFEVLRKSLGVWGYRHQFVVGLIFFFAVVVVIFVMVGLVG